MSKKFIKAICDEGCKKEFKVNRFITKKVKLGIEKTYFRCPNCKQEYVAYYASAETKRLQKQMRKLHREEYEPGSTLSSSDINVREAELKSKIKQSVDEARRMIEGG